MLFVNKAIEVHGNRYDYSGVEYIDAHSKVLIVCKDHGEFWQLPRKHLKQNCPKCSAKNANNYKRITYEKFIERAIAIHHDKYEYQNSAVDNVHSIVPIFCKTHGLFSQKILIHLNGSGCPKCANPSQKIKIKNIYDSKWFKSKAVLVHGNRYNYDKLDYVNSMTKVNIVCHIHGEFSQVARDHLVGRGCPQCGIDKLSCDNRKSIDVFSNEASKLHYNKYSYSMVIYNNQCSFVDIICPIHGVFQQTPKHHLRGQGCPACNISSGHGAIYNYIKTIYNGRINLNDRDVIRPYEIDIYLPDSKVGIEYNGLYFHSFDNLESTKDKMRHSSKCDLSHDFKLLQFFENEWLYKSDIVKSMICHNLGLSSGIMARKCEVKIIDNDEYRECISGWHLSGYKHAHHRYGLYRGGECLSVVGISPHSKHQWEIVRYATKPHIYISGGFSKMVALFKKHYNPDSIMTFADRRYSKANCYIKSGFILQHVTKPNYFYVKGDKLYSRVKFQKHKLHKILKDFDPRFSEPVNMFNNGYRRIWDAGNYKLIWRRQ